MNKDHCSFAPGEEVEHDETLWVVENGPAETDFTVACTRHVGATLTVDLNCNYVYELIA